MRFSTHTCMLTIIFMWMLRKTDALTHWGRVTHICANKLTIIGSDNGLSPGRRQSIIWNNAGILLIAPLGTNFNGILIEIHILSFKKIHLKMLSGKWRPSCLGLKVLSVPEPSYMRGRNQPDLAIPLNERYALSTNVMSFCEMETCSFTFPKFKFLRNVADNRPAKCPYYSVAIWDYITQMKNCKYVVRYVNRCFLLYNYDHFTTMLQDEFQILKNIILLALQTNIFNFTLGLL